MGLYHIKELLSGRCSSRVELIVSDLVSDPVSGLDIPVVSVDGLTGPSLRRG